MKGVLRTAFGSDWPLNIMSESQLTLKMTSSQDAEMTVTNYCPSQGSFHADDQIPPIFVTPGLNPFSI